MKLNYLHLHGESPDTITVNDVVFSKSLKPLAKTQISHIQLYTSSNGDQLVLKHITSTSDLNHDNNMINEIKNMKKCNECDKLFVKTYYNDFKKILMEYADGTLNDLAGKLKWNDIKNILICIVSSLIHLKKHDLYYTDMKPENIFYFYKNEHEIQIKFGDYGDMTCIVTGTYGNCPPYFTYKVPFQKPYFINEKADIEAAIVMGYWIYHYWFIT